MKDELEGKCVPPYYYNHFLDKLRRITQGNKSSKIYVTEFFEFLTRYNILDIESDVQVFSQFRVGLKIDIENKLWNREITELKKAYALVQDLDAAKSSYTFMSHNQVSKFNSS